MMHDKAICINCKNHIQLEIGSVRAGMWYNQRCKEHPTNRIDWVLGVSETEYDFCRNHNKDGLCISFKEKP